MNAKYSIWRKRRETEKVVRENVQKMIELEQDTVERPRSRDERKERGELEKKKEQLTVRLMTRVA